MVRVLALMMLAFIIVKCTKEELNQEYPRHSNKEVIDTLECTIIKNKGSLVTAICGGDTVTIINK